MRYLSQRRQVKVQASLGIQAVTSAFSDRKNEVEFYIVNGKIMLLN